VQAQVGERMRRLEAGSDDRAQEREERPDAGEGDCAAPAPQAVGHGLEPAALCGDDAQAEQRQDPGVVRRVAGRRAASTP
jgi:hypothetical protein